MPTRSYAKGHMGFTLIELLVVISIIGLLSTLAVVSLNNARINSRNAKRTADMNQLQTAFQLYYDTNNNYTNACSGTGDISTVCYDAAGARLVPFMAGIGGMKDPSTPVTACAIGTWGTGALIKNGACSPLTCQYAVSTILATTFDVRFCLETGGAAPIIGTGYHRVTPAGIE